MGLRLLLMLLLRWQDGHWVSEDRWRIVRCSRPHGSSAVPRGRGRCCSYHEEGVGGLAFEQYQKEQGFFRKGDVARDSSKKEKKTNYLHVFWSTAVSESVHYRGVVVLFQDLQHGLLIIHWGKKTQKVRVTGSEYSSPYICQR